MPDIDLYGLQFTAHNKATGLYETVAEHAAETPSNAKTEVAELKTDAPAEDRDGYRVELLLEKPGNCEKCEISRRRRRGEVQEEVYPEENP